MPKRNNQGLVKSLADDAYDDYLQLYKLLELSLLAEEGEDSVDRTVKDLLRFVTTKLYTHISTDPQPFIVAIHFKFLYGSGDLMSALKIGRFIREKFPTAKLKICFTPYNAADRENKHARVVKAFSALESCVVYSSIPALLSSCARSKHPKITFDVAAPSARFRANNLWQNNGFHFYQIDEYCGHRTNGYFIHCKRDDVKIAGTIFAAGLGLSFGQICVGLHINPSNAPLPALQDKDMIKSLGKRPRKFFFAYCSFVVQVHNGARSDYNPFDGSANNLYLVANETVVPSTILRAYVAAIVNSGKYANEPEINLVLICPHLYFDPVTGKMDSVCQSVVTALSSLPTPHSRKLNIFAKNRLEPSDFQVLLRDSYPEVLVTGDQSLVEALMLEGKVVFYELRDWKSLLFDNIQLLAQSIDRTGNCLVMFLKVFRLAADHDLIATTGISELAKLVANPKLQQQFGKLAKLIATHFNLYPWLEGLIKRDLLIREQPELMQQERSIQRSRNTLQAFTRFTAALDKAEALPQSAAVPAPAPALEAKVKRARLAAA